MDAPQRPTVYIETYGCQMNVSDSELMFGQLAENGYTAVDQPEQADVILVNTCAIREHAEQRVIGRLGELKRHMRRDTVLGVTGCMAQRLGPALLERAAHVSLVVGPDGYRALPALIDRARQGERATAAQLDPDEHYEGLTPRRADPVKAWITVQRGCDYRCTYCIVPTTRGAERSRPLTAVLDEVRAVADSGTTEVVLLGQTVNSYDDGTHDFGALLEAVGSVAGIRRIRFTSPHPNDFSARVVTALASTPAVCEHVHLPMQSGSDRTLKRMLRRYTQSEYLDCVARLRRAVPGLALTTDIIVGFPGETEADFADTLRTIDDVGFDDAYTFQFSLREGTPATRFPPSDMVPDAVARERLARLIEVVRRNRRARHLAQLGSRAEVLVERPARRSGAVMARTRDFKTVLLPAQTAAVGQYYTVDLGGTTGSTFTGCIVEREVRAPRRKLPMAPVVDR